MGKRKSASKPARKRSKAVAESGGADRWVFYEDAAGGRRWRRISRNGRTVGASSEAYQTWMKCLDNATRNGFVDTVERVKKDCSHRGA